MRHQRAATYHTRYQKSQLKQQALGKTTCKSNTSFSEEVVSQGFLSGAQREPRRDTRAERAARLRRESGLRRLGGLPAPPPTLTWKTPTFSAHPLTPSS